AEALLRRKLQCTPLNLPGTQRCCTDDQVDCLPTLDGPRTHTQYLVYSIRGSEGYRYGSALGSQAAGHFLKYRRRHRSTPESARCSQPFPGGSVRRRNASDGCTVEYGTAVRVAFLADHKKVRTMLKENVIRSLKI